MGEVYRVVPHEGDEVMVELGLNNDNTPWLEFFRVRGFKGDKAVLRLGTNTTFTLDVADVEVVRKAKKLITKMK